MQMISTTYCVFSEFFVQISTLFRRLPSTASAALHITALLPTQLTRFSRSRTVPAIILRKRMKVNQQ